MSEFLNANNAIIGIAIALLGHLFLYGAKFVLKIKKEQDDKKDDALKYNTQATLDNTKAIDRINDKLVLIPKLQVDLRRYYLALKIVAGPKWSEVSKQIIEEEKLDI